MHNLPFVVIITCYIVLILIVINPINALNCPSEGNLTNCKCDEVKSEVYCDGVKYEDLRNVMQQIKISNSHQAVINTFKVRNYRDDSINFLPFLDDHSFINFDFSNNKRLSFFHLNGWGPGQIYKLPTVNATNVNFSNCSLQADKLEDQRYLFRYLFESFINAHVFNISYNNIKTLVATDGFDIGVSTGISASPKNAKILDVTHNQITDVGYKWFYGFTNILKIDLSYNYIANIWNEAFSFNNPSAGFITTPLLIDLSNNYLNQYSRIYETAFRSLKRPSTLNLSNNQFTGLQEQPFGSFLYTHPENQILIYNNSIICNCDLSWIKDSDGNQSKNSKKTLKEKIHGMDCVNCRGKSIFDVKNVCKQQCGEEPEPKPDESKPDEPKLTPGKIVLIVVLVVILLVISLAGFICYRNNICNINQFCDINKSYDNRQQINTAGFINHGGQVNIQNPRINAHGINNVTQEANENRINSKLDNVR